MSPGYRTPRGAEGPLTAVAFVIPARNAASSLRAAVESAQLQEHVREIAVAVGPSTDETESIARELAAEDPRVSVVANPVGTTPAALNRAIAVTRSPVVARLDAHATLPSGYVERAVATLEATGAGNVGGRQVPVGDGPVSKAIAGAMGSWLGTGGATYRVGDEAGPTETVYLGVFRREALEEAGGFDERMIRNQDYELNLRLRRAGWEVWFDPRLEVPYRPRGSLRGLAAQYYEYGRWRRVTARLHPGSLKPRQLAAPTLVLAITASLVVAVFRGIAWVAALVVSSYLLVVLAGAVTVSGSVGHRGLVALSIVTMHLAWGVGFLVGPPRGAPKGPSGEVA